MKVNSLNCLISYEKGYRLDTKINYHNHHVIHFLIQERDLLPSVISTNTTFYVVKNYKKSLRVRRQEFPSILNQTFHQYLMQNYAKKGNFYFILKIWNSLLRLWSAKAWFLKGQKTRSQKDEIYIFHLNDSHHHFDMM